MKKVVVISLGNNIHKDRTIISFYIDYENEEKSRFFRKGVFDGEMWENAQTHIQMPCGVDARQYWYCLWRNMRLYVRNLKEKYNRNKRRDRITGWRFEPTCFDSRGYAELDPKRLP